MRSWRFVVGAMVVLTSVTVVRSAAPSPILPDTFEDGTTMGWFVPGAHPAPPANVASGGPAGVDDSYLQLTAIGGAGAGSRLAVLNGSQWAGDYLADGVLAIAMDVNNLGPDEVTLRLLFEDFDGPGPPVNLVTTLTDVVIPSGSGWVHVEFSLDPSNLLALIGAVPDALSSVDVLRIFHNPDPDFPGPGIGIPVVNAVVGVDNITAVPEPAAILLVAGGILASWCRRHRRS
jgi:hypothetical protein